MAKVSLFTQKTKTKEVQVFIRCSHKSEETKFYTGFRIDPKYWKKDRCTLVEIDRIIQKQRGKLETVVRELQYENPNFTLKEVRERFTDKPLKDESPNLIEKVREYMQSKDSEYTLTTMKNYRTLLRHIQIFEKENKVRLNITDTNTEFFNDFKNYLWKQGNTNGTVEKLIIRLKSVLNWCEKRGDKVTKGDFSIDKTVKEVIFLDADEIKQLREAIIPEYLHPARDMFLFSCYTGMRWSDINNWNQNVRGDFIYVTQVKTKDPAVIPLNRFSREVLERYGGSPPKVENATANKYLKEVARKANIDSPTSRVRFRGNERLEKVLPKHELLTFHAGRASFIMLHLSKGIAAEVIMKMTGHKDWKSFKKYVNIREGLLKDVSVQVFG